MTKVYRVASGDPGGQRDRFGFCLTAADVHERKIFVLGAHQWKFVELQNHVDYETVEQDIMKIYNKKPWDMFVCEKNNTGHHVINSLKTKHNLRLWPIWTASGIKSQKIIEAGRTMDKIEHVDWINRQRLAGKIVFPKEKTDGIIALESEIGNFVRKYTNAGTVRYEAEGTIGKRYDDMVMAFMVNTYYIRRILFGDKTITKRVIFNKKYQPAEFNIDVGSAIPDGSSLLGTSTYQPSGLSSGGFHIR